MSSSSFDATIELRLKPSMRALQWLFALHVLAAALAMLAMDPSWPMVLVSLAIAGSWLYVRRHPAFGFGPRALVRLTWHADGHWQVARATGSAIKVELLGSTYVLPRLVVLNFRDDHGRRLNRVLLGDETEPEVLRRLRARLAMAPLSA